MALAYHTMSTKNKSKVQDIIESQQLQDRTLFLWGGVDDKTAVAILAKGLTAHYLLFRTYRVKRGDFILIHAAAGGVGQVMCQWAKDCGAKVIGTVSSQQKADIVRKIGCDYPIIYTQQDFVQEVKRITGGEGVPVVYDSVGKEKESV